MAEEEAKEEEEEEKKEEEKKYEVTILDETVITTYPKLKLPYHQVAVTYSTPEIPPRTIFIPFEEVEPEEPEEARKQFLAKEGPLYEKYLEIRARKLREDIEAYLKAPPAVILV